LDGDQLDGAGNDRTQLLIGPAPPLQPASVDHQHVDVLLAEGVLPGGHVVEAVHPHRHADGGVLAGDGPRQLARDGAGQADILGPRAGVQHRGHDDYREDDEEHDRQAGAEAARAAPLAQLPEGDQPTLPQAAHAATARRNSSDRVGG
jgi:hypothetical protein